MSDSKWISLRNAAIRINNPTNINISKEWDILGWPEIDPNCKWLKEFVVAASNGEIRARGDFAKASIFSVIDYWPEKNRKSIVNGMINCEWKPKLYQNEREEKFPYIIGYEIEDQTSDIGSNTWRFDSQVWKLNSLIDFEFDFKSDRSKNLKAQPWSAYSTVCLEYDRPEEWEQFRMPEFHLYFNVEVDEYSLNKWLIKSRPKMAKKSKYKSNIPRKKGPRGHKDWLQIHPYLEQFVFEKNEDCNNCGELYLHVCKYLESQGTITDMDKDKFRKNIKNQAYWPLLDRLLYKS
jgi:hypothetical protein